MQYIRRNISDRLASLARQFPAVLVTGARQTGKTTLVRQVFPGHRYVSLDLPSAAGQAEQNPGAFLADHPPPVVIDEVQYAPGLLRQLKVEIDREREARGRFVLTGSQQFSLMAGVAESLAGRVGLAELDTLSATEILAADPAAFDPGSPADLARFIARGTFPELWADPGLDATEFHRAYVATYLERDVRNLVRVGSLRDFERFLRLLALRSGQLLNRSDLARDVGVSLPTIGSWLPVLETSHQITLLPPYHSNRGKRLIRTPKVYFHDTGLLCFLLGLPVEALGRSSPALGAIWETLVFGQIARDLASRPTLASLWFWRDLHGTEVDFVVEVAGRLRPVEAKLAEVPSPQDLAQLTRAVMRLGQTLAPAWLATPCREPYRATAEIEVVNPLLPRAWDSARGDEPAR